ncbi:agmatinase [Prochlorococcus sp. MIT 1341]|uniref:agmatinase n=1 Tax=Prochlorococcus sp. MIT 1341 TaxID=3096221 RepID=UPI002A754B82|nr:agmatinase [Prochlorococcus sp. MIT 1341]
MFNTEGPIFMQSRRDPKGCSIGIIGVPYDGTTSFRAGTRFGPAAIREVSTSLETYCPQLKLDLENIDYADLGSLDIPIGKPKKVINLVKKGTKKIIRNGLKPLILGGEHSITSGAVQAVANFYPDVIMIQLDAHADLRNQWQKTKYSHACAMRRCLDVLPSKQLIQVGIRSGTKEEFDEIDLQKRMVSTENGELANSLTKALSPHKDKPIYLTVDLDWFDPSVLPGTGTPEPGGFYWNDFASLLDVIRQYNLIAADVVELAPELDPSKCSSVLAAKVTRSLIMLLST